VGPPFISVDGPVFPDFRRPSSPVRRPSDVERRVGRVIGLPRAVDGRQIEVNRRPWVIERRLSRPIGRFIEVDGRSSRLIGRPCEVYGRPFSVDGASSRLASPSRPLRRKVGLSRRRISSALRSIPEYPSNHAGLRDRTRAVWRRDCGHSKVVTWRRPLVAPGPAQAAS
jgi:hypothetical protein